jgi:restriction endonuclease Mrr
MRVPREYELSNPVVEALRSLGGSGSKQEIAEAVIGQLQLPEDAVRQARGFSGQTELEYRLAWALTVLKTCGLVANPKRSIWLLTESGFQQQPFDAAEIKRQYFIYLGHAKSFSPEVEALEEKAWRRFALEQFFAGYCEADSVYDTLK